MVLGSHLLFLKYYPSTCTYLPIASVEGQRWFNRPPASMTPPQLDSSYIGWRLQVVIVVFLPLQLFCVVLRFYARRLSGRKYGWDDWLIIASFLGQCVLSGLILGKNWGYLAIYRCEAGSWSS